MKLGKLHPKGAVLSVGLLLGLTFLVFVGLVGQPHSASATTISFSQCNNRGAGPRGAPLTVTCNVNIVNNITPAGNTSTATFSRTCTLNPCTGSTIASTDVVNAVHQCNGSDNVGGSTTICNVTIVNNISVGVPIPATALNVNQCNGSGTGGGTDMSGCASIAQGSPQVTQCNGSGTGGGGKMTCSASGTTSSLFAVSVDQCNGSENGGGSFVTCTVSITNNITQAATPTSTSTATNTPLPQAATATQAAAATATRVAQATSTQAAAATATQIVQATSTQQAAAATATQVAASNEFQQAQATAVQQAQETPTVVLIQGSNVTSTPATSSPVAVATTTTQAGQPPAAPIETQAGGFAPPSAGDAGLLPQRHNTAPYLLIALVAALALSGAIVIRWRLASR